MAARLVRELRVRCDRRRAAWAVQLAVPLAMWMAVPVALADATPAKGAGCVTLRILRAGCQVQFEPLESPFGEAWLDCGCARMRIVHPANMVGLVRITTGDDALEFLRFFSGPGSFLRFPMVRQLEIKSAEKSGWAALEERVFRRHSLEPVVKLFPPENGMKVFEVRRAVVVLDDGHLYRVTEVVFENGSYQLTRKQRVVPDIGRLGVLFHPLGR
jgi:hypothetical protein